VDDLSRVRDLCVLKKPNHGMPPLPITEDYSTVNYRDEVLIIGAPLGAAVGEFKGHVMELYYRGSEKYLKGKLVVSAASISGVSGSPIILSRTGEVIGVLVMGHKMFDHISFAVNGKHLRDWVNSL